jgi:hypothetical protein
MARRRRRIARGYTSPYRGPPINDDDDGREESGFQAPVLDRPWGDIGGQYPASASQNSAFTANQRMQQTPYAAFGAGQSVCYQDPPGPAAPLVAERPPWNDVRRNGGSLGASVNRSCASPVDVAGGVGNGVRHRPRNDIEGAHRQTREKMERFRRERERRCTKKKIFAT